MKPCPFCGGNNIRYDSVDFCAWYKCLECGAISPAVFSLSDKCRAEQARAMWNERK